MGLQKDLEFQQTEIKKLNKKFNVDIFSTAVRGGKAFAAEQIITELKKGIFRLKALEEKDKNKIKPGEILIKVTNNLNNTQTAKCDLEPEYVEKKSLE